MSLLLLILACSSAEDGGPAGQDSGDGGAAPCDLLVLTASPLEGELDVDLGRRVAFTLEGADPSAAIRLRSGGQEIPGRSWREAEDSVVWFEADGALPAASDLVATLEYCAGEAATHFRTMALGPAVSSLEGSAYLVDFGAAQWVSPPNLGTMLGVVLSTQLVVGVGATDAGELQWVAGASEDGKSQNTCKPTTALPVADFSMNPWFQVGPADLSMVVREQALDLRGFKLAGEFSADGGLLAHGVVAVEADMRQVLPVLVDLIQMEDAGAFCEKIGGFGISCTECSDGSGPYCVDLYAEDLGARALAAPLQEIAQADCHPDCPASWKNPACDTSGF